MAERYGAPGELQELLEDLEAWMRDDMYRTGLNIRAGGDPGYNLGRRDALAEVIARLVVNA